MSFFPYAFSVGCIILWENIVGQFLIVSQTFYLKMLERSVEILANTFMCCIVCLVPLKIIREEESQE